MNSGDPKNPIVILTEFANDTGIAVGNPVERGIIFR